MAYFKIGSTDFSAYVSGLKISTDVNYNAQQNANCDTVVDYINKKRTFEVEIIPLDSISMAKLLAAIDAFSVSISFRNPKTNALETGVSCIIASHDVSYYTIQDSKIMYQKFNLKFNEL